MKCSQPATNDLVKVRAKNPCGIGSGISALGNLDIEPPPIWLGILAVNGGNQLTNDFIVGGLCLIATAMRGQDQWLPPVLLRKDALRRNVVSCLFFTFTEVFPAQVAKGKALNGTESGLCGKFWHVHKPA